MCHMCTTCLCLLHVCVVSLVVTQSYVYSCLPAAQPGLQLWFMDVLGEICFRPDSLPVMHHATLDGLVYREEVP